MASVDSLWTATNHFDTVLSMDTTKTAKTVAQAFALGLLASGPLSFSQALTLGGTRVVEALKELTKHRNPRVVYSAGAYRAVSL